MEQAPLFDELPLLPGRIIMRASNHLRHGAFDAADRKAINLLFHHWLTHFSEGAL